MLETVLNHLHNWFPVAGAARAGTFIIVSGTLTLHNVLDGQYYKIEGSVFNDGLHKYGDEDELKDETFTGRIVPLAIPKAVIELAERVGKWAEENPVSDKASESFGGYSYSKAGLGTQNADTGGWQTAFRKELNQWKKVG